MKRYRELLARFADNQGDAGDRIKGAVADGDTKQALLLAHTLKGTSGNVGAMMLHEEEKVVEALLQGNNVDQLSGAIAKMTETLGQICRSLQTVRAGEDRPQRKDVAGPIDLDELLLLMERLRELLVESDTEARSVLEEIQERVRGTWLEADFHRIEGHVADYDGEEALAEIEKILQQL